MRRFQRKNILFYSILSAFIILFYQLNNTWVGIHEDDQVSGCDSFGYARQAELFRKSTNFSSALDTSIKTELQSILNEWGKNSNLKYKDWSQMIAPHAHYFRDESQNVILQYPPGTGWLLSFFRENKARKILWIISFAGISSLFLARINILENPLTNIFLGLSCLGSLYITNTFSTRSDSIAPSCLIAVIIASLTVRSINFLTKNKKFPLIEVLLISLIFGFSLSIRPANILFFISPLTIYLLVFKYKVKYILRSSIFSLLLFCLSTYPLLQANKINTGSFFSSTYSSIDTTFDFSSLLVNLSLINESFDDSVRVILVLLFSIFFSFRAWTNKEIVPFFTSRKILISLSWIFMVLMIFLMASKPIFNLYYLAPQLVLTTSISSMSIFISQSCFDRSFYSIDKFRIFVLTCSILTFILGYILIQPSFNEPFPSAKDFSGKSIIWADSIGSKLLYYHDINTAKLHFGSKKAQEDIIKYLSKNNVDQFVLDEANQVSNFKNVSSGSLKEFSKYDSLNILKFIPD